MARQTVKALITYKTKVRKMDGKPYIDYKVNVTKHDCNLRPHQHYYYNCDLFNGMLKHAVIQAQQKRTWQYLDELPEGITVNTSNFLATVTIQIEV